MIGRVSIRHSVLIGCATMLLAVVTACGSSTPTSLAVATAVDSAPPTSPAATTTPLPASIPPTTLPTPAGPTLAHHAWTRGQTVLDYAMAGPGAGWVHTNRGLWQTADDGATWANATPPRLIVSKIRGLAALDANRALLAVADVSAATTTYYLWRTVNGGATWAYVALPPVPHDPAVGGGVPDPPARIDFVDPNTAFVLISMHTGTDGMNNYIFETADGGTTWTPQTYDPPDPGLGSPEAQRVQFMSATVGTAEYATVISSTTSGWGSWTHVTRTTAIWGMPTITFLSSNNWVADVGLDADTANYRYSVSRDQGHTWLDQTVTIPSVPAANSATVAFFTPLTWNATIGEPTTHSGFDYSGNAYTYLTTDGGAHWTLKGTQPFGGSRATWADQNHGWTGPNPWAPSAGTGNGKLYVTTDGGHSWHLVTP